MLSRSTKTAIAAAAAAVRVLSTKVTSAVHPVGFADDLVWRQLLAANSEVSLEILFLFHYNHKELQTRYVYLRSKGVTESARAFCFQALALGALQTTQLPHRRPD